MVCLSATSILTLGMAVVPLRVAYFALSSHMPRS
jgi:hypothetical protein